MENISIIKLFRREKKYIVCSLVIGFIIACLFSLYNSYTYSKNIQKGIADNVVRFHVLPNSNSPSDIMLKYKVRDAVLEYTNEFSSECNTRDEFINKINENIENIKTIAKNTLVENNSNYDVDIFFSNDVFPYKEYGKVAFPAGEYLGLRIEIGQAEGNNWWCVMFPSMCFTDESCTDIKNEGIYNLENCLDYEEYEIVTSKNSDNIAPKMKFKVVELWQEVRFGEDKFVTNSDK